MKTTIFFAFLLLLGGEAMAFKIETTAFQPNQPIPKKYTCEGEDLSPPLTWSDVPAGTKSLALISDDPDAPMGTWVHWVLYDLPADTKKLEEGIPKNQTLANGAKQGMTDFKRPGYGGPCPPPGKPHRYYFKLYALDALVNLPAGATKSDLLVAMKGHILAQTELMGTYQRK